MADDGAPAATAEVKIRDGGCGGCTLCCKVMGVASIAKPAGKWCQHCHMGLGCGIYETRPSECINFICGFLSSPELPEEWRPAASRLVLDTQTQPGNMLVYVDPGRPDAWRRQPFLRTLRGWARASLPGRRVMVHVGGRSIVMLPDHAVDLGTMAPEEVVVVLTVPGTAGFQVYAATTDAWEKTQAEVIQGLRLPALTPGYRTGVRLD